MQLILPDIWGNMEDKCFGMRQAKMKNLNNIKFYTEISRIITIRIQISLIKEYLLGKESL